MTAIGSFCCTIALGFAVLWPAIACQPAAAAHIAAVITDDSGKPLAHAVVTVAPEAGVAIPAAVLARLATATIDQHDETFVPEVVVIHTGGTVVFRDSDTVRHHVYSFSAIAQFQFIQHPGDVSLPVRFNHPGVSAIGCNIHDFMIAYVYVTDAPWAVVTGEDGRADFSDLPAGRFTVSVWHPRLWPDSPPLSKSVLLGGTETTLAVPLRVMPPTPPHARSQLY